MAHNQKVLGSNPSLATKLAYTVLLGYTVLTMRAFTREVLAKAVVNSNSVADVIRKLGRKPAGGTHSLVSRRIKEYNLDTSHFLGCRSNLGRTFHKKSYVEVLVKRDKGSRKSAALLRRSLVGSGVPYKCNRCGLTDTWNDSRLILQVNHLNRDWLDDRRENLEFLCPNCHSQTEGWCGSKGISDLFSSGKSHKIRPNSRPVGQKRLSKKTVCLCCGKKIGYNAIRCNLCHLKTLSGRRSSEKGNWISTEELRRLIWEVPATQLAKKVGVSSSMIKKRCKRLGIPTPPRGFWSKLQNSLE